jgi:hypothetical protein
MYQVVLKYPKCLYNIPNGHKYINIFLSKALQNLPKWNFWFEKKHLATLFYLQNLKASNFSEQAATTPSWQRPASYVSAARKGIL